MIEETLLEAIDKMEKAVGHVQSQFQTVRTGRAAPALVERINVEYYGSPVPIQQLASIQVPEARQLLVRPHDRGSLGAIEKAIKESDLGVNPSNDGAIIRIVIPQLSEERRRDMVKVAKSKGEDAKVSLRGVRRKAKEEIDKLVKDGEVGEDDGARGEKELEALTHRYVAQVEELVKHKEAELLEV